jgi:hypothetical protein
MNNFAQTRLVDRPKLGPTKGGRLVLEIPLFYLAFRLLFLLLINLLSDSNAPMAVEGPLIVR